MILEQDRCEQRRSQNECNFSTEDCSFDVFWAGTNLAGSVLRRGTPAVGRAPSYRSYMMRRAAAELWRPIGRQGCCEAAGSPVHTWTLLSAQGAGQQRCGSGRYQRGGARPLPHMSLSRE